MYISMYVCEGTPVGGVYEELGVCKNELACVWYIYGMCEGV